MNDTELKEKILKLKELNAEIERLTMKGLREHPYWNAVIENRILLQSDREFVTAYIDKRLAEAEKYLSQRA